MLFYKLKLGITNCYLIKIETGGYLLVDTSILNTYKKFVGKLEKLNISLTEIKYIFLTHHHYDHTGFLKMIKEASGAKIILHKNAEYWLAKGQNNPAMKGTTAFIRIMMRLRDFFAPEEKFDTLKNYDDNILTSGDTDFASLGIDGINAKIITLPAHTNDSIGLIFDNGNAFIGDAAMNMFAFLGLKYKPLVAENPERIFQDWEKIQNRGAKILYPAHGKEIHINSLIKKIR